MSNSPTATERNTTRSKFTVTILTDSAAFHDPYAGSDASWRDDVAYRNDEIRRNLSAICNALTDYTSDTYGYVHDENGNRVGEWAVTT